MYGIYANIGGILMVNVTTYSIHGSYGWGYQEKIARSIMAYPFLGNTVVKHHFSSNWWYTYPPEDMSSSDWIIIPTIGENKIHVPNHQPVIVQNSRRKHGFAKDELPDLGPLNGAKTFGWELLGIATSYQLLMIINQHQPLITAIHWTVQYQPFSNQSNTIR